MSAPRKILQVVGGLNRAGVETWLMHVLRNIDRDRFHMDFLVHGTQTYDYEEEATRLGAGVIRCLHPKRPWTYARNFERILREHGPYDVVHSHVHYFSGVTTRLAHRHGVPVRIVHSHLDTTAIDAQEHPFRKAYSGMARAAIRNHATLGLAVSEDARKCMFSDGEDHSFPVRTLHCSIDLEPFRGAVDRAAVRRELGIPADALVIGHVGRFDPQKNHAFLVRIAEELARMEPKAWFLLVGDGELRPGIQERFRSAGLLGRVTFTGTSESVPRLMLGAMDAFVFPSLYEGLGLALVEAQGAGLPCLFSDTIPHEADIVASLIHRLSISDAPSIWAGILFKIAQNPKLISQTRGLNLIEQSCFGTMRSIRALEVVYSSSVERRAERECAMRQ